MNALPERVEAEGFRITEAEHQWLREINTWLRMGGIDRSPERRTYLHVALEEILRRFDDDLAHDRVHYMTARALLQKQLNASLAATQ